MTRKSALSLGWILIACLPGCLHTPFRGAAHEEPAQVYDRARTHADVDRPTYSTAVAPGEPTRVLTKMPHGSERDVRVSPSGQPDLRLFPDDRPKPPLGGSTGVVTIGQMPIGGEPSNALFQPATGDDAKQTIEPLAMVLHHTLTGEHQKAIAILKNYDDATQEFFMRVMPPLTLFAKKSIDKMTGQEWIHLKEHLKGMDDLLRTRCELLITKLTYCKRIRGFADYEALPENHAFLAKTNNRPGDLVELYVELKNFASKQTKDGEYLTKLVCSLELKDMNGAKVWSHAFDKNETTYRKSSCVNDYHGNYSFYVPALTPGTYQLTIQIVDETIPEHRRVARKSHVFRVTPVANALAPR